MSSAESDNVRLIRRIHRLFNELERDPSVRHGSEAEHELLDCFDEDVTFIQPEVAAGAGLFDTQGRDGFRDSWDEWLTTWVKHETEVLEVVERGDRVLVMTTDHLKGRDGLELTMGGASIYTIRGSKVVRLEVFPDAPERGREVFQAGADGERQPPDPSQ